MRKGRAGWSLALGLAATYGCSVDGSARESRFDPGVELQPISGFGGINVRSHLKQGISRPQRRTLLAGRRAVS